MLNPNEKIDSWDVVVRTTEGRELSFLGDLHLGIYDRIAKDIDEIIEEEYPVTWTEEKNDVDKRG